MLTKGKVITECLLANALREQIQICQQHMMLMHKYECQYVDIKKITVDIPPSGYNSVRCLYWDVSDSQVGWQALADEAHKFQVLALPCWFVAASPCWERSNMQLPWLQLVLSPQDDFFSAWGTAMGNAQTGCKMSLFLPKSMSLSTKQSKLMQTPDRTAASWPGLSKTHFSTPFKGSNHKKKFVIHVTLK